jgi:hypothetical protein
VDCSVHCPFCLFDININIIFNSKLRLGSISVLVKGVFGSHSTIALNNSATRNVQNALRYGTVIFLPATMLRNMRNIDTFLNPLTPELNPSAQRCLTRFVYWGFCFLNRAIRQHMREKPTNTPIIRSVY